MKHISSNEVSCKRQRDAYRAPLQGFPLPTRCHGAHFCGWWLWEVETSWLIGHRALVIPAADISHPGSLPTCCRALGKSKEHSTRKLPDIHCKDFVMKSWAYARKKYYIVYCKTILKDLWCVLTGVQDPNLHCVLWTPDMALLASGLFGWEGHTAISQSCIGNMGEKQEIKNLQMFWLNHPFFNVIMNNMQYLETLWPACFVRAGFLPAPSWWISKTRYRYPEAFICSSLCGLLIF